MQFSSLLIAAFASVAAAQNQASLAAYTSAYSSFIGSLQGNPTFLSQVEQGLASSPALIATLQAIATSVPDPKALTAPPAFFTELPTDLQPLFSSIFTAERSLADQYGLLSSSSAAGGALSTASVSSSDSTAATAVSGATTTPAGTSPSTATPTGAAPSAGVAAMGLAAGLIGGIAVLL